MTSALRGRPLLTEGINTEAEMLKEFGPRCPLLCTRRLRPSGARPVLYYEAGCACCDAWLEWDLRNPKLEDV